jgi:transcriptional regulator with XRE-family HTH domain
LPKKGEIVLDKTLFQKEIGEKLRDERRSRGLTIERTAKILGLSPSYLGLVERGERCLSSSKLVKFCNLFGVSTEYLLIGGVNKNSFASKKDHIIAEVSGLKEYDLNILLNIIRSYKTSSNETFPYE